MSRSFWPPAILVVLTGLALLLAAAAGWVSGEDARAVGDVMVSEPTSTSGTVYAPTAVVFGLAGLGGGIALAVMRGTPRRVAAVVCLVIGLVATVVVIQGINRAAQADGSLTPAPVFAAVAAVGIATGAALALRAPSRPPAVSRYRVESERPDDDEWDVASGE